MRLKNKNVLFFTKLIVFGALFMMILPFILFGENNYITVHDNLDQFPPFWSIAKKVGLFSFDVSTESWITHRLSISAGELYHPELCLLSLTGLCRLRIDLFNFIARWLLFNVQVAVYIIWKGAS